MPDSGHPSPVPLLTDLPVIDLGEVDLRRTLFQARGPLQLKVAGHDLAISSVGETREAVEAGELCFAVSIGEGRAWLQLPESLISQLLAAIEPSLLVQAADDDLMGMLLELLFSTQLKALEARLQRDVRIARAGQVAGDLTLHLQCTFDGAMHAVRLSFERALARDLCALLALLPAANQNMLDLPLTVQLCLGSAVLPLARLDALVAGDVIIPHTPALVEGKGYAMLGERWAAPAEVAGRLLTLSAPFQDTEEHAMNIDKRAHAADTPEVEDGKLDDYPIRLVFEVGRSEMSLGELRSLGAGHVFALGRDPEQSVDIIAGGRRIASGQLVRIGERLGVRVLRLGQDG